MDKGFVQWAEKIRNFLTKTNGDIVQVFLEPAFDLKGPFEIWVAYDYLFELLSTMRLSYRPPFLRVVPQEVNINILRALLAAAFSPTAQCQATDDLSLTHI